MPPTTRQHKRATPPARSPQRDSAARSYPQTAPKRDGERWRPSSERREDWERDARATRGGGNARADRDSGATRDSRATRDSQATRNSGEGRDSRPTRDSRGMTRTGAPRWDRGRPTGAGRRGSAPGSRDRVVAAPQVPELTGPNAFVDLGVPTRLAAVLASQAIIEPTAIQGLTIPAALAGRDVLGRGRTGSGKTLAFVLPLLAGLHGKRPDRSQPRALVLVPTRELAMQVLDVMSPLAAAVGLRAQLVIGGASYDRQIRGLERADVVVATPGRLVDLAQRGAVGLGAVRVVVLDEADHMADLGFMPEIEAIMGRIPTDAQGLLFSATLDDDVDRLVRTYLHDPVEHSADPATATVGTMAHHVVLVHPKDKDAVTSAIALRTGRTVAFVRTQLGADRLAGQLSAEGVRAAALHGGMKQGMRTRTLEDFRRGRIDVLVATDVAARGLHVDDIDLVLHVDLPHGPKEYLHRSGRTARAGASGTVISLATLRQERAARAITAKAGVTPGVLRARPGDEALRELVS